MLNQKIITNFLMIFFKNILFNKQYLIEELVFNFLIVFVTNIFSKINKHKVF